LSELFAAVDETEDGGYLAMVVGVEQVIAKNSQLLPKHMSRTHYSMKVKKELAQSLNLKNDILVHCLKYGLPVLRDKIKQRKDSRAIRLPQDKINRKIGYELIRRIDTLFGLFTLSHGIHLTEIEFEVDNGFIRDYLRHGGYMITSAKCAHKIADCVAYANHQRWKLDNVVEHGKDFEDLFHKAVIEKLL
jgi:hypothetical protein